MKPRPRWFPSLVCGLIVLASACQPVSEADPDPITPTAVVILPSPTETPAEIVPEQELLPAPATGTPDSMRFILPTPGAEPVSSWRPPLYPVPWAPSIFDHFYFSRPIAADTVNWPLADYRYGGVLPKSKFTHTGIDITADLGTPVLAAGPGDVVWAGWGLFTGDRRNREDPYGLAVMIRHDFGYKGLQLFTVYAHMQRVNVIVGQWLDSGDVLGQVGETGDASGPHLHFEVRLGGEDNFSTRNPELWMAPPQGWGLLVARIGGYFNNPVDMVSVEVESVTTGQTWEVHTYRNQEVNQDEYYAENMVLSDLPAGTYRVYVPFWGRLQKLELEVYPGQVTYFNFRGSLLFNTDLPSLQELNVIQTPAP